jgi:hypothetical protein
MASANFRLGTAATNSAGTTWSWRAYDTACDATAGSYVKVELESVAGVSNVAVTLPSADDTTLASALPTVTTVQASKTATFQLPSGSGRSYSVRVVINGGIDGNNNTQASYDKRLAVHVLTAQGYRKFIVGETDESNRTYGYTPKLNTLYDVASWSAYATAASVSVTAGGAGAHKATLFAWPCPTNSITRFEANVVASHTKDPTHWSKTRIALVERGVATASIVATGTWRPLGGSTGAAINFAVSGAYLKCIASCATSYGINAAGYAYAYSVTRTE